MTSDSARLANARVEFELDVSYLPMWHAPTQKLGIYLCESELAMTVDGVRQTPDSGAYKGADDIAAITDRLTLRSAHRDQQESISGGTPNVIAVPVRFSTLQDQYMLHRFVDVCRYLLEDLRRMLIWEVRDTRAQKPEPAATCADRRDPAACKGDLSAA